MAMLSSLKLPLKLRRKIDGSGDVVISREVLMHQGAGSASDPHEAARSQDPIDKATLERLIARAPVQEHGFLRVRNPRQSERALQQLASQDRVGIPRA